MLLPFQLISYLSRKSDFKRKRFLIFSLVYLLLSATWILDTLPHTSEYLPSSVFFLVTIVTILYSYQYLAREVGLRNNVVQLVWMLIHITIVTLLLSLSNLLDKTWTNLVFLLAIVYMELALLYYARRIIIELKLTKQDQFSLFDFTILVAILVSIFIPFIFFFLNNDTLKFISMNFGFLAIAFAYIHSYVRQMQFEWQQLEEIQNQRNFDQIERKKVTSTLKKVSELTSREIEVAELMMQGFVWKEIADRLNISEKTATKHGSNIYSKFNVSKREDFIEQFKSLKEL